MRGSSCRTCRTPSTGTTPISSRDPARPSDWPSSTSSAKSRSRTWSAPTRSWWWPGSSPTRFPTTRSTRGRSKAMKTLAVKAGAAGVRIGCENCCAEQRFLMSPREFATFLDDVGSPHVGIHLDVGNIHETGFAEQWIEIARSTHHAHPPEGRAEAPRAVRQRERLHEPVPGRQQLAGHPRGDARRCGTTAGSSPRWSRATGTPWTSSSTTRRRRSTGSSPAGSEVDLNRREFIALTASAATVRLEARVESPDRGWRRRGIAPRRRRPSARIGEGLSACARDVRKTGCCRERVVCCDGRTPRHDCDHRNVRHVE